MNASVFCIHKITIQNKKSKNGKRPNVFQTINERDCQGWMRCLHCHGGEALQEDSHSLARDRCYYCQHSKYGNGRMECEKCQVRH